MKGTMITVWLIILLSGAAGAQQKLHHGRRVVAPPPAPPIIMSVPQQPEFKGDARQWLLDHLRYPLDARENGWEGRVLVEFEVLPDGSVQVMGIRKSSGFSQLDGEALRVIRSMPPWKPAKAGGRPVPYAMILPVTFRLN